MWKALIKLVEKWAYRCEHSWENLGLHKSYAHAEDTLPYSIRQTFVCNKCMKSKIIIK